MAELGHNFNIQCKKLFQELKATFPSIPDDVVQQCMKSNRHVKGKCIEDLSKESQKYFLGRYTRALLSHQMEQLFKLEKELRAEKHDMHLVKAEIGELELRVKQKAFSYHGEPTRLQQHSDVKKIEKDIEGLRGACDDMVKKVTSMTGGKVPLGEDSIKDYKPYLSPEGSVPETACSVIATAATSDPVHSSTNLDSEKWNCSECTFANHPSLDTCEICEMPRITLGTNNRPHMSGPCFCHPQTQSPRGMQTNNWHPTNQTKAKPSTTNTTTTTNNTPSNTTSSIEAHPPSRLHSC